RHLHRPRPDRDRRRAALAAGVAAQERPGTRRSRPRPCSPEDPPGSIHPATPARRARIRSLRLLRSFGTEPGPTGQHPDRARGALPGFPARPAGGGFRLARAPVPGAPVPVAGALAARAAFARGFFAPAVAHRFFGPAVPGGFFAVAVAHRFFGLAVPGGFFAPAFDDGFFMRGPGRFARDRPVAAFDVPRFFGTGAR